MSCESPTTAQNSSTGIGTTRNLVADVIVPAAIGVELTLRLTVPPEDANAVARERAMALVRDEWDALVLAFARALRGALEPQGVALRELTVIATLAETDPQLILHHHVDDEGDHAGT